MIRAPSARPDAGGDKVLLGKINARVTTEGPGPIEEPVSDEALMAELAAGKQDPIGILYSRYAPRIFAVAARSLDRATAEEIVQDVFVTVWRKASTFDAARGPVRPWLLQIARFRIVNELRRKGRRPRTASAPEESDLAALADPSPGPAEEAWEAYRRSVLTSALEQLPVSQRQALGLAFFENLSHGEIASVLDLPLGTAKSRIRTGLASLKTKLAPLALVLVIGVLAGVAIRFREASRQLARSARALTMLTASDSESMRLTAEPGVAPETHATYRMRPGGDVAVLTLSNFGPPPAGRTYQAWARIEGRWISAGVVAAGPDGRGRLIAEGHVFGVRPEALEVTVEREGGSPSPEGPRVVAWRR
ncbi:MAG: sigma-70 family RNA polymerase sigma factor [Acidobacteriota bacterium]